MTASASAPRPDFLVIVVDDMGWSDLSAFGGEIATPHLDALVARGVRLTNFHTSPLCATTRAMLMTGCDHHEVGMGTMVEIRTAEQTGQPGYEGWLTDRAATIAERLRDAGYRTMMAGKWHLGVEAPFRSMPRAKGFEHSWALMQGEHNHYGGDQTPETASTHGESRYRCDDQPVTFPLGAYSTDFFADRLIDQLEAARGDARPLFAYLAFTAPHSPLQAPEDLVARYRGVYDEGPEALREKRLARLRALGIAAGSARPAELRGGEPWASIAPEERRVQARKMEVYAAMVDALDRAVGRVVDALRRIGRLDNTTILFFSDNGPSGTPRERTPPWRDWIAANADNRLENIGRMTSYTSIGPRWAQAQSAPFFLFKRYTSEGGVRTCAFASGRGVAPRRESEAFLHVMDVAPTLLAMAGLDAAPPPGKLPMRGVSAAAILAGTVDEVHAPDERIAWELAYGRGVKIGDWKAIYLPAVVNNVVPEVPAKRWLLYNIARDPGETTDLAAAEPQRLQALIAAWEAYARETGVVVPDGA
ncbi:MAG: sulfatase-like hydrolase/transferase [Burkholderiales bacterium]|nr:sulfatase-like hydrolase/transferase [Burkholderiales bacterium]